jgi:hypothetical protein
MTVVVAQTSDALLISELDFERVQVFLSKRFLGAVSANLEII